MATSNEEVATAIDGLGGDVRPALSLVDRARAFYELGKPNLTGLVVISGVLGFYLGSHGAPMDWWRFLHLAAGMALTAAGACAINMVIEADVDRKMRRTRSRPIPSGRVSSRAALIFSLTTFALGFTDLWIFTGAIPALLSLITLVIYAFVYTPMKSRGPLSIWIGAVPGAIPPVMGYAAVEGHVGAAGLSLFAILFAWQFPHFLSLAWMYRDDYARAGFRFLPASDDKGTRTGLYIVIGCLALIFASLAPAVLGLASVSYAIGSILAGIFFLIPCLRAAKECTHARARSAFLASVTYLPILLALLVLDRAISS